jgi:predicted kinase
MPKMYLMSGPSGAGKSTLAYEISRERNVRFLSIENFYKAFFGTELIHEHRDEVWESFAEAIRIAAIDGVDVLIDTNSPSRADREWFVERFPGFEIHLVVLNAPKELCLKNNKIRDRVIPDEEIEKIFARLEPVTEDELKNYAEVEVYENLDNTEIRFVKSLK